MPAWTRRGLFAAGAAVAGRAALAPKALLAAAAAPPLPPPLPADVFKERQTRLRAAAKARGIDAVFVTPSTNLAWSANLAIGRSERLTALLLLTDGPAVLITPSFEEANHKRNAVVDEVRTWNEDQDPFALTAKALAGKKTVGVEGSTAYATVSALQAAGSAKLEEATALFDPLRMIKSEQEQGFIHEAGRRTTATIDATHKRMRAGMTESEVARILHEEFANQGMSGWGLVQFGPSSAFPTAAPPSAASRRETSS